MVTYIRLRSCPLSLGSDEVWARNALSNRLGHPRITLSARLTLQFSAFDGTDTQANPQGCCHASDKTYKIVYGLVRFALLPVLDSRHQLLLAA